MAIAQPSFPVRRISGRVGDSIYKWYGDRLVVTRVPRPSSKKPTKTQQAGRDRFGQASRYAERARKDAAVWALYEKEAKRRRVPTRAMAIHDYLASPIIQVVVLNEFYRAGGLISIGLGDRHPFKTVDVVVTIRDSAGKTLESGPAQRGRGRYWDYTPTQSYNHEQQQFTVEVTAKDRLGKTATAQFTGKDGKRR